LYWHWDSHFSHLPKRKPGGGDITTAPIIITIGFGTATANNGRMI
jgi:hypothetical protein